MKVKKIGGRKHWQGKENKCGYGGSIRVESEKKKKKSNIKDKLLTDWEQWDRKMLGTSELDEVEELQVWNCQTKIQRDIRQFKCSKIPEREVKKKKIAKFLHPKNF